MSRPEPRERAFLLEIGTEEMPARMIEPSLADLARRLRDALVSGALASPGRFTIEDHVRVFGTPRRLAVKVVGLLPAQPDRKEEITGPAVGVAYDPRGRPTKAAEGFARAQGVAVSDLRRISTPKGECVGILKTVKGRPAAEVLSEIVPPLVLSMTFPKTMRWGSAEFRFVRPVHSVVALLDEEIVDMTIAGIRSGRDTFGHRFFGKSRIPLRNPGDYPERLRANHVLADIDERREAIVSSLRAAAGEAGARLAPPPGSGQEVDGDPDLLREVLHLVEWPLIVGGTFDRSFLDLPPEILVTAMRHHQKYFSLLGADGRLLNRFLTVANARDDRADAIRRGNEWVLKARLADARFFWDDDRRTRLDDRSGMLDRVSFHEKLGSYSAKTLRMARLAGSIVEASKAGGQAVEDDAVQEAARLCKNDLTTQMVKEFPELEGIVGGLYARMDGLRPVVADAIYAHYLPRGANDPLPPTPEGRIVSLADRLDSQAGIFLLGIVPTGSRDPYALRRSVQSVCRILIEGTIHLSLSRCLDAALDGYMEQGIAGAVPRDQARLALLEFYRGRLQHLGEEASLRQDSVRAALASSFDDPFDARLRMEALEAIRSEVDFNALVAAHKRIKNILPSETTRREGHAAPRPEIFRDDAEGRLHGEITATSTAVEDFVAGGDYRSALQRLARVRPALDRFFETVMVMAKEPDLRQNRLALLGAVSGLFLRIGDFSEIVQEGETVAARSRGRIE
jgi:glycyl-tRNA synthetase beta chain